MEPDSEHRFSGWREANRYLVLSSQLIGSLLGSVLIGYLLDRYLGTSPWLILTGALLGVIGALWGLVRLLLGEGTSSPRKKGPSASAREK